MLARAAKVFSFITDALKAETLQGQAAARSGAAGKQLLALAGIDPNALLASMGPEQQEAVRNVFRQ